MPDPSRANPLPRWPARANRYGHQMSARLLAGIFETAAMTDGVAAAPARWREAWPDLLAFAAGLAVAWQLAWETTDLVWSLWLSSLLVGYAMIVWDIFGPAVGIVREARANGGSALAQAGLGAVFFGGGLFLLAFFTVHFGMFHFVHSVFLSQFFPVTAHKGFPGSAVYVEVFRRYWYFVPLAALAERQAFKRPAVPVPDTSVKAVDVNRRRSQWGGGSGLMAPYKNVVRMHVLIFFFAFAHFAKLENFWIYAVVYAAYFFPWRLVKGKTTVAVS